MAKRRAMFNRLNRAVGAFGAFVDAILAEDASSEGESFEQRAPLWQGVERRSRHSHSSEEEEEVVATSSGEAGSSGSADEGPLAPRRPLRLLAAPEGGGSSGSGSGEELRGGETVGHYIGRVMQGDAYFAALYGHHLVSYSARFPSHDELTHWFNAFIQYSPLLLAAPTEERPLNDAELRGLEYLAYSVERRHFEALEFPLIQLRQEGRGAPHRARHVQGARRTRLYLQLRDRAGAPRGRQECAAAGRIRGTPPRTEARTHGGV